jgi:hypothetical protein
LRSTGNRSFQNVSTLAKALVGFSGNDKIALREIFIR